MSQFPPIAIVQLPPTRIRAIMRDPLAFLLRGAQDHGPFVQYPLGIATVYQISDPALLQHVLQTNARNYSKDTVQYRTLAQITGNGLLTSDGRSWLTHRRLMQPAFHRQRLESYGAVIVAATTAMLDRWQARTQACAPIDVDAAMMQLTLEIVGQTLFNLDLRREAPQMTHAVLELLDHVVHRATHPLGLPRAVPTPRNRRVAAALRQLDRLIADTIADRRRGGADRGDMLSMLLLARDEESGEGLSDEEIRDEMVTLLIAGHETVASALTWSWYLLSRHAGVRRQLAAEVDEALNGRLPTVADLPRLPLTRMVFDETLRLYPPAWLITRRALADDDVGAHTIPAGSILVLSPYVTHRNTAVWPNPLGFDPWRFTPEATQARPRFAYIPFGGGPRLCIGDRFALLEAPLILATVTQRLHLDLLPGHPIVMDPLVTLRPRHGMWMTAVWRETLRQSKNDF
ncbi:MAG: cytochrome P450 [Anaerolineales bacterium]|nr:cytochrome P450 [Anaerolineales bacterium]